MATDIITLLTCPPSNIPSILQIYGSTKNGLLQLATLLNRNQITNEVINNQERKGDIVSETIKIDIQQQITTNINTTSPSFQHNIKLLQSAFLKLAKALILFKQKKLQQKDANTKYNS